MPIISSRTPEGSPGRCPVCGRAVQIERSRPFGDAPCPHCGSLLWYFQAGDETHYFDIEQKPGPRRRLRQWIAERLGIAEDSIGDEWESLQQLGVDSLDIVELVMELEEELDNDDEPKQ